MALFNYSHPRYAARTLRALQTARPDVKFSVELSPSMSYAFRYVIMATLSDGRRAVTERVRLSQLTDNLA